MNDATRRLCLGCGPDPVEGWTNYDRVDYGQGVGNVSDATLGLPYQDGQFDLVVAHHSLQMIPWISVRDVLGEVHRVIAAGGRFRVSVPDPLRALEALKTQDATHFPIVDEAETSLHGKFCAYLTWYSEARTIFTQGWLQELLTETGFADIRRPYLLDADRYPLAEMDGETDLDTRRGESLYLVGVRP